MRRTYGAYFLRSLKRKVSAKRHRLNGEADVDRALAARTLRDFDDAFTAPIHGFAGAEDYYARSDVRRHLARIRVPALLVQARDDPFLPTRARLPRRRLPPILISRRRSPTAGATSVSWKARFRGGRDSGPSGRGRDSWRGS